MAAAALVHSGRVGPFTTNELAEGLSPWCGHAYTLQNVPPELLGVTLFVSSQHIVPEGSLLLTVPPDTVVFIFSESHRDGGFPHLGWESVNVGRFGWVAEAGKSYQLRCWRQTLSGGDCRVLIPLSDALIGGVAVQFPEASRAECDSPELEVEMANLRIGDVVEVHASVCCDGCEQSPILGPRYRCGACHDYDLCGSCHRQRCAGHPEHDAWVRIPSRVYADVVSVGHDGASPPDGCFAVPMQGGSHACDAGAGGADADDVGWEVVDFPADSASAEGGAPAEGAPADQQARAFAFLPLPRGAQIVVRPQD